MLILGIETSCDDTSLCLARSEAGKIEIIETSTFSQIDIYKEWGGVVPEIASRNHLLKLKPLLKQLIENHQFSLKDLSLIGVTSFPGLLGPLLTGVNLAKSISFLHQTPIFPVNHLFAHLEAIHIDQEVQYPYLGLILSGGHTLFTKVSSPQEIKILASTIDDAAGEAFDKAGKMLGLDYPSGAIIDKLSKLGDEKRIEFPIGLSKEKENPNLSFSGLKSALQRMLPELNLEKDLNHVCASYQYAIVTSIVEKFSIIYQKYEGLPIVIGGGVACNSKLRSMMKEKFNNVQFVSPKYCTDNGAMIANYAFRNFQAALNYPESLKFDAKNRFINKKDYR